MDASYNVTTTDFFDDREVYKETVVEYNKYHKVNLDLNSMMGVSFVFDLSILHFS